MKKWTKKILSLALMAIMLTSLFVACGNKGGGGGGTIETSKADTDENPNIAPVDYKEHEFTFITQEGSSYNIKYLVSSGAEGAILDDSIDARNKLVEEKYNIKITQLKVSDITTEVRRQIMGGNVEFDAIVTKCGYLATMAQEGLLYNLLDIERFNWDASYWDSNSKEQLTIRDKLYFANCGLNIDTIGYLVYFNKKLVQDYNLTDPFELMKNNQWTIDNWATMVRSVSKDLDNDGIITYMDQIGTLSQHHLPRMMLYATGVRATTMDETGYARLSLMDDADKTVAVYEKVKDAINDTNYAHCMTCSNAPANGYANKWQYLRYLFTQDHYLFNYVTDSTVSEFADMESEFGMIPYPKYNPEQEKYMADYPYNNALFALPSIIEDLDRTANIIEDINYYSTITTIPTWYDTLLSRRYARDDESEQTLHILRENQVYDLALFYDFGGIRSNILDVDPTRSNIARSYDAFKRNVETKIKEIYEKYDSFGTK